MKKQTGFPEAFSRTLPGNTIKQRQAREKGSILEKAVSLKTEMLVKLILLAIIMSWVIALFTGYVLGMTLAEKDCFTFLAWWKVNNDCEKCGSYDLKGFCTLDQWYQEFNTSK